MPKSIRLVIILSFSLLLVGCKQSANLPLAANANTSSAFSNNIAGENPTPSQPAAPSPGPEPEPLLKPAPVPPVVSKSKVLSVSFISQAPYEVWDELHQEACEEASMIMVDAYYQNQTLTKHLAEQQILNLVKWQEAQGYLVDATAAEVAAMLKDYFNLEAQVVDEVTVERIKAELNQGNLIIVPAAGRRLGNPYFQTPGPIYHMLVIRGYNETQFVTNDPGTKRGEGFSYPYQQLLGAVHDWDHDLAKGGMTDAEIESGQKVMVVISGQP